MPEEIEQFIVNFVMWHTGEDEKTIVNSLKNYNKKLEE